MHLWVQVIVKNMLHTDNYALHTYTCNAHAHTLMMSNYMVEHENIYTGSSHN